MPEIIRGSIVVNVKSGKRYIADGPPYVGWGGQLTVYVRQLSGRGQGHYMKASNLKVVSETE